MSWGGLNPALTSWRNGIVARFPERGTQSDGARADKAHGSTSQHQEDADGTVDAYDSDVNYLGSSVDTGTALEQRIVDALNRDFLDDARAQLWISRRRIANRDISGGAIRRYDGDSDHDHHTHYQTRQSLERDGRPWSYPRTDAILREIGLIVDPKDIAKIIDGVVAKLDAKYGDVWRSAASAWDDAFGRDPNRQSAGSALIETRDGVRSLVAALPVEPTPTDPA